MLVQKVRQNVPLKRSVGENVIPTWWQQLSVGFASAISNVFVWREQNTRENGALLIRKVTNVGKILFGHGNWRSKKQPLVVRGRMFAIYVGCSTVKLFLITVTPRDIFGGGYAIAAIKCWV